MGDFYGKFVGFHIRTRPMDPFMGFFDSLETFTVDLLELLEKKSPFCLEAC